MSLITKHPYRNCDVLIGIAHWFNGLVLSYAKKDSDRGVMNLCSKHYRSIFEGECFELTIRRSQRTRKNLASSVCVSAMHASLI